MQNELTIIDELVRAAAAHPMQFDSTLPVAPSKHVSIVARMDSRIDVFVTTGALREIAP